MAAVMDIPEEMAKAKALLKELNVKVEEIATHIEALDTRVNKGELSTAKGVSFLEVKYHMLLSYLINLSQLMGTKIHGKCIEEATVERLVEVRTVLERMRPIDQKLKYQVDKLLKTAATGAVAENDPLRLKPNPDNLESKIDGEDEEGSDEEAATSNTYRPPKISAMQYDADDTVQERQQRLVDKKKKRALSSSIMRDLKAEHCDGPMEIQDDANLHRAKVDKSGKEREEYEEKYFVRMQTSKKEQNAAKKLRTMGDLNSITHFGNIGALTGEDDEDGRPKKKRKSAKGGKKGGKKKKIRHH